MRLNFEVSGECFQPVQQPAKMTGSGSQRIAHVVSAALSILGGSPSFSEKEKEIQSQGKGPWIKFITL